MKGVIDRFEGNYAIVEMADRSVKNVLRSGLPFDVKEGDVIELDEHGVIMLDEDEAEARGKEIEKLMDDVWDD